MGLSPALFLAAVIAGCGLADDETDWEAVWLALQEYHSGANEQVDALRGLDEGPSGIRLDVARSLRAAAPGTAPGDVHCAVLPELGLGGAWAFSLALAPGAALDQALITASREAPDPLLGPVLSRGYERFLGHSEAARGADAYALAIALPIPLLAPVTSTGPDAGVSTGMRLPSALQPYQGTACDAAGNSL